jgi:hypothetical protein
MYIGSDVSQLETYTADSESLIPDPSCFEFEIVIPKLKRYISEGSVQIPQNFFK